MGRETQGRGQLRTGRLLPPPPPPGKMTGRERETKGERIRERGQS